MTALWLLAAFAQTPPSVLDDPAFRFCHSPSPGDFDDTFCALLDGLPPERCPGLRELCADPEAARSAGCDGARGGSLWGEVGSSPSVPEGEEDAPLQMPVLCGPAAPAVSTVFGWVIAMIVVLGIAGIAAMILRTLGLRPDRPAPTAARPIAEEPEGQAFADAVDDVPDLPSADLLAAARQAREAGRLGEAAVFARGAVLRRLGERRVLRLHRARTDREYTQMAEPAVRSDLDAVFTAAEQHRWGKVPLTGELVERALTAAARLLALGVVLFAVPAAWGADRYGPSGDIGLRRVLERHGHAVHFRAEPLSELSAADPVDVLVIDRSGLNPTDEDWDAIRAWVLEGGVLWVGGQVEGFPELGEPATLTGPPDLAPALRAELLPPPRWPAGTPAGWTGGEAWSDPSSGGAGLVGAPVGEGYVLALGEPLLLWNGALVDPANEAFLGEVPYRLQARGYAAHTPIRIELATQAGSSDPEETPPSLANLRLLPFVVQLLILWLVVVAWRGWPFTRLADPPERGRLRFVDHVDAVARQYQRRRATGHVLKAYAAWALDTAGRAGLMLAARRHGASAAEAEALVGRAEAAAQAEAPENSPSDLELLEELWKLTRPR